MSRRFRAAIEAGKLTYEDYSQDVLMLQLHASSGSALPARSSDAGLRPRQVLGHQQGAVRREPSLDKAITEVRDGGQPLQPW